ncbi:hypothetical protein IAT38_004878 [Cryptococcus sp. DSM 104549]
MPSTIPRAQAAAKPAKQPMLSKAREAEPKPDPRISAVSSLTRTATPTAPRPKGAQVSRRQRATTQQATRGDFEAGLARGGEGVGALKIESTCEGAGSGTKLAVNDATYDAHSHFTPKDGTETRKPPPTSAWSCSRTLFLTDVPNDVTLRRNRYAEESSLFKGLGEYLMMCGEEGAVSEEIMGLAELLGTEQDREISEDRLREVREKLSGIDTLVLIFRDIDATPAQLRERNNIVLTRLAKRLSTLKDHPRSPFLSLKRIIFPYESDENEEPSDKDFMTSSSVKYKVIEALCRAARPDVVYTGSSIPSTNRAASTPIFPGLTFAKGHMPKLIVSCPPPQGLDPEATYLAVPRWGAPHKVFSGLYESDEYVAAYVRLHLTYWHPEEYYHGRALYCRTYLGPEYLRKRRSTTWVFTYRTDVPSDIAEADAINEVDGVKPGAGAKSTVARTGDTGSAHAEATKVGVNPGSPSHSRPVDAPVSKAPPKIGETKVQELKRGPDVAVNAPSAKRVKPEIDADPESNSSVKATGSAEPLQKGDGGTDEPREGGARGERAGIGAHAGVGAHAGGDTHAGADAQAGVRGRARTARAGVEARSGVLSQTAEDVGDDKLSVESAKQGIPHRHPRSDGTFIIEEPSKINVATTTAENVARSLQLLDREHPCIKSKAELDERTGTASGEEKGASEHLGDKAKAKSGKSVGPAGNAEARARVREPEAGAAGKGEPSSPGRSGDHHQRVHTTRWLREKEAAINKELLKAIPLASHERVRVELIDADLQHNMIDLLELEPRREFEEEE